MAGYFSSCGSNQKAWLVELEELSKINKSFGSLVQLAATYEAAAESSRVLPAGCSLYNLLDHSPESGICKIEIGIVFLGDELSELNTLKLDFFAEEYEVKEIRDKTPQDSTLKHSRFFDLVFHVPIQNFPEKQISEVGAAPITLKRRGMWEWELEVRSIENFLMIRTESKNMNYEFVHLPTRFSPSSVSFSDSHQQKNGTAQ